jgi:hypothetical protein
MLLKTNDFEELIEYRTKYDFNYPNKNGIAKNGTLYFLNEEIEDSVSSFLDQFSNVREFGSFNLFHHLEKYNKKALKEGFFNCENEIVYNTVFISKTNLD